MLAITKRTGEPFGFGRDQLVYNFEFMNLPRLMNRMMKDIRPTASTLFVACSEDAIWLIYPRVDDETYETTFRKKNAITPRFYAADHIFKLPQVPKEIYFIAFPNWDNDAAIAGLTSLYTKKDVKIYDSDGYQLKVIHFLR